MGRNRIVITSDTLTPGLKEFPDKLDRAVGLTVDYFSPRVQSQARHNAPWTDRTGNARNGLMTNTEHDPKRRHAIILRHSVPYGIWLEVRFDGRWAIIIPTIKEQGAELMGVIRDIFRRLR